MLKYASAEGLAVETDTDKKYSGGGEHFSPYSQQPWTLS